MYERIVKSLRSCMRLEEPAFECIEMDGGCCDSIGRCIPHLMDKAADAIEELSAIREEQKAQIILMAAEIEELKTYAELYQSLTDKSQQTARNLLDAYPKWIPVTERLPEQRINQNTLDFEYVLCATTFGDVRPYKYGRRIGQGDAHFWNGAGYADAYITHWMPLPEPPKEEKP